MKKMTAVFLSLLIAFAMTACRGEALPEGMDQDALLSAGQEVFLLLVEGEYETVHEMLREDQRAQFTVEDIRSAVTSQLDDAGFYKQIEDRMTTAQTIEGERYGIAVLYCEFSEEDVLVRISFDADLQLVGFALKQD